MVQFCELHSGKAKIYIMDSSFSRGCVGNLTDRRNQRWAKKKYGSGSDLHDETIKHHEHKIYVETLSPRGKNHGATRRYPL